MSWMRKREKFECLLIFIDKEEVGVVSGLYGNLRFISLLEKGKKTQF